MKVRLRFEKVITFFCLIFEDELVTGHVVKGERLYKAIDELFVNF